MEVSFANYGWERVEYEGDFPDYYWDNHEVGLATFQWRLSHQWQGRRNQGAWSNRVGRIKSRGRL